MSLKTSSVANTIISEPPSHYKTVIINVVQSLAIGILVGIGYLAAAYKWSSWNFTFIATTAGALGVGVTLATYFSLSSITSTLQSRNAARAVSSELEKMRKKGSIETGGNAFLTDFANKCLQFRCKLLLEEDAVFLGSSLYKLRRYEFLAIDIIPVNRVVWYDLDQDLVDKFLLTSIKFLEKEALSYERLFPSENLETFLQAVQQEREKYFEGNPWKGYKIVDSGFNKEKFEKFIDSNNCPLLLDYKEKLKEQYDSVMCILFLLEGMDLLVQAESDEDKAKNLLNILGSHYLKIRSELT